MADLMITENITLDGVTEATEGWFAAGGDDDVSDVEAALQSSVRPPRRCSSGG